MVINLLIVGGVAATAGFGFRVGWLFADELIRALGEFVEGVQKGWKRSRK